MFRRLVTAGALAGLIAGLVLTVVQYAQVIPLIQEAERFETAAAAVADPHVAAHDDTAWAPQDGLERATYTAISNIAMAVGFGLLLSAGMSLRPNPEPARGALWGLAGFAVFFVAPSLGLPPEIPGAETADLAYRQTWWLVTVTMTAFGLGLLAFNRNPWLRASGLIVLLGPQFIGVPPTGAYAVSAPEDLARQFIMASTVANGVFWIVLGATTAWLSQWEESF